ncbi:MAG: DNA/RNA non-specific endonuclease [Bacteroidetes bacterium]|nr:MAG: DNA/RNA non-specific endonuclease [Bacteroidota bacterium]
MSKKQKHFFLVLIIILSIGFIIFLIYRPDKEVPSPSASEQRVYHAIPFRGTSDFFPSNHGDQLLNYKSISLAYNEQHEQAIWVCYLLTKNRLNNPVCKRNNRFKSDPNVHSKSASTKDYSKSGYDRGHLAPAADMLWSEKAMQESFYMSNMSPQKPGFNRGIWKKLEGKVRKLALIEDSLIIITGPIFEDNLGSIGQNKVSVPGYYYKAIIDISAPQIGSVAFIIPNRNTKLPLDKFAISIDSLEKVCRLDFMAPLPDLLEKQLESRIDKSLLEHIMQ